VIPHRVQVRPPPVLIAALAQPQAVGKPLAPLRRRTPRNLLRRLPNYADDLHHLKWIGALQNIAERVHRDQKRFIVGWKVAEPLAFPS
jgi:hypothetical protein